MRTTAALVFTLLLSATAALGVRVEVEPAAPALYVGQTFTLQYHLIDATKPAPPPELSIEGCTVRYSGVGRQSHVRMFNGVQRAQESYVYSYSVRADEAGRFIAPELEFQLPGGATVRSESVGVVAAHAPTSSDFELTIECEEEIAYVGQPVKVTWKWKAARDIERIELAWDEPEGLDVAVAPSSDPERVGQRNIVSMMGVNAAIVGKRSAIDGRNWEVYTAEMVIVPQRAGDLVIPGSRLLVEADTGRRQRGLSVFDTRRITEWFSSNAPSQTLRVRPLPEQGKPAGFSGLVGRYRVDALASPRSVRVGDPIELKVITYGPAPSTIEPDLDLASVPEFTSAFRIDDVSREADLQRGRVTYTHTLRAQRNDVDVIPPIELPYFDPELGRYAVARTSPIPLEVTPTRVVTLADAQRGDDADITGSELETRTGGLRANVTDGHALVSEQFDLRSIIATPLVATGVLAPPALFVTAGAIALARTRRERSSAVRTSRRALPEAMSRLKAASDSDAVAEAVRGYLAVRVPEGGASMTPDDVTRLLGENASEVAAVLRACDESRFGGGAADIGELVERASRALQSLERGGAS